MYAIIFLLAAYARFRKEYFVSKTVNRAKDAASANGKEGTALNKNKRTLRDEPKCRDMFFMVNIIVSKSMC